MVIYVHATSKQQAASLPTEAMEKIADWMTCSCLTLNLSKMVGMFFALGKAIALLMKLISKDKGYSMFSTLNMYVIIDSGQQNCMHAMILSHFSYCSQPGLKQVVH